MDKPTCFVSAFRKRRFGGENTLSFMIGFPDLEAFSGDLIFEIPEKTETKLNIPVFTRTDFYPLIWHTFRNDESKTDPVLKTSAYSAGLTKLTVLKKVIFYAPSGNLHFDIFIFLFFNK